MSLLPSFCLLAAGAVSVLLAMSASANAADATTKPVKPAAPAILPGDGLAHHDFMYAGENFDRRVYIIRGGKVVWTYDDPKGRGEISDAILLPNGNILMAHQYAVKLIGPDSQVIWNYDAPPGTEIHTAQQIGQDHILFIQNGKQPMLRVINMKTNQFVRELPLPVAHPEGVHGQFRHARLTPQGTILVGQMDRQQVTEFDADGKEIWSCSSRGIWGVKPLANGNVLLAESSGAREVNRKGETVWSCGRADLPEYKLEQTQLAWRLPSGNTLFNAWHNPWNSPIDRSNLTVQAIEVTPDKKVVWALRAWGDPVDLGPATTIQLLDMQAEPADVFFGDIR